MKDVGQKLSAVAQNVILGSITSIVVGINLRIIIRHIGATDTIWIVFFLLGPALGYISGKERERMERLQKEKEALQEDISKIQRSLKQTVNKYRLLLENANDAIFVTTAKGKLLLFNEAVSLFSGYRREELKKMTIHDLRADESDSAKDTLLDNSVWRYEEKWRNKNQDIVFLEINAKWIKLGGNRLILHIGRHIVRRNEANGERRNYEMKIMQQEKMKEITRINAVLADQYMKPLSQTMDKMHGLMNKYPDEKGQLSALLADWGRTRQILQTLALKGVRDCKTGTSQWDVHQVIMEELQFLKLTNDYKGYKIDTQFNAELNSVHGRGIEFSMAFHVILRAVFESLKTSTAKAFTVSTRLMDETVLVEIEAIGSRDFKTILVDSIDPVEHGDDTRKIDHTQLSLWVTRLFFEPFGGRFDMGDGDTERLILRLRIPRFMKTENAPNIIMESTRKKEVLL